MNTQGCPRCGGQIAIEDSGHYRDRVCLACGWRKTMQDEGEGTGSKQDPFEQLVDACKTVLEWATTQEQKATATARTRGEQRQRVEKAMAALTGGKASKAGKREGVNPNLLCKTCGNHYASKAHKDACRAVPAEA